MLAAMAPLDLGDPPSAARASKRCISTPRRTAALWVGCAHVVMTIVSSGVINCGTSFVQLSINPSRDPFWPDLYASHSCAMRSTRAAVLLSPFSAGIFRMTDPMVW